MNFKEGRHIIVDKKQWEMIVNALDLMEIIVTDQPIKPELLDDLKWHFKPDKIAELSTSITRIQ